MLCPHGKCECEHYKVKPRKSTADPRIKSLFTFFESQYTSVFGVKPVFSFGRDGKIIKGLLSQHTEDNLIAYLNAYFLVEDNFFKQNAYNVPTFARFVQAQFTGGYNSKPPVEVENKKAKNELLKYVEDRRVWAMPSNASKESMKLLQSIGIKFSELKLMHSQGEDIFAPKAEIVDYKVKAGGDNG